MASNSKGTFQPDSDVHITFEDQQKINKFARLNAKLDDIREEIKARENDLKNIEEGCDEIALADDDAKVPYLIGEVFIYQDLDATNKCLDSAKFDIENEIEEFRNKSKVIKEVMSDLKSHLYGKFGSHINLEADDD